MYGKYHKHSKEKSIAYKHNWLMFGRWEIMMLCKMWCFFFFFYLEDVQNQYCWEAISMSLVSVHIVSKGTSYHFSRLSFQGDLYSKQLWKIEILSLSQAKRQNSVQYKRSNFPKLRVLFCMQPIVCAYITGPFSCFPVEILCQQWFNRQGKGCYTWRKNIGKDVSGKNNRIVHNVFVGTWCSWITKYKLGKGTQCSRV